MRDGIRAGESALVAKTVSLASRDRRRLFVKTAVS
jgi:hypothetical protein